MAKPKRTEAELIALLSAALRRTDFCNSVTVAAIYQVEDKTANWDADALSRRGRAARVSLSLRNTICDRSTICWCMIEQLTIVCPKCGHAATARDHRAVLTRLSCRRPRPPEVASK